MSISPSSSPPRERPQLAVPGHGVTWGQLLLSAVALLLLMSLLAGVGAWWAWHHLAAQVRLKEQQADIMLPKELAVRAAVTQQVQVRLDQTLPVRLPIHQALTIPLQGKIPLTVSIDTVVPISLDVPVKQVFKVDQVVELDTQVKARILGMDVNVPVRGSVPIKTDVPIEMVIPVRHKLPVALVMPASIELSEPLRTQIDTVVEARVPIKADMSLPVTAPVSALLSFPQRRVQAGLHILELTVPFDEVALARRNDAGLWRPLLPAASGAR